MKHHTEAERAEFEKSYSDRNEGSRLYCESEWRGWQAARRAPAEPVPQDAATHNKKLNVFIEFANQIDFAKPRSASLKRKFILETRDAILDLFKEHLKLHRKIDGLAAAPQPPEAAPVQMPEPALYTATNKNGAPLFGKGWMFSPSPMLQAQTPLYTEQQVRELLAAHGIGKDKE